MVALIPRPFIDELLNRTDLVEFVDGYVPLKKQGNSYIACCPFHSEKTPSFNVVTKKQFYHCFGCGVSGNAISFAMNYLHLSFTEAIETLATRIGLQVPHETKEGKSNHSTNLYQFLNNVAQFYQKNLKNNGQMAVDYLKQRQVSGTVAKQFQLGYAPAGWQTLESAFKPYKQELLATGMIIAKDDGKTYDRYRQRIMFPIHDRHGRIIGFGGRAIEPSQKPKYLNSPETVLFQKSRELYGLHHILRQNNPIKTIIIVEGYIDVIALAQYGINNAVATLGTATSSYHIQLLSKHCKQLIFCFDGDSAGRQAAWRALESSLPHVNSDIDIQFIFLPEGQDPDSLVRQEGAQAFAKRLEGATSLHQFFIDTLMKDIESNNLSGKSRLIQKAKPYLHQIPDGPYKALLIDALARLTHLDAHRIHGIITDKSVTKSDHTFNTISRTPTRIAIAILLQHPEIYIQCMNKLSTLVFDGQKQKVLKTIMEQIAVNPTINTATLIEAWRDTPLFDALAKLAVWHHQVPDHALTNEFIDTIFFIAKQDQETAIEKLLNKAQKQGLTEEERLQLQNMLKKRHLETANRSIK